MHSSKPCWMLLLGRSIDSRRKLFCLMNSQKYISYEQAPEVFAKLKHEGKKIVQCHGTFDLIHPWHIYHLEEAKALGDLLVVTVTADKFVSKGPGRPYFNDKLRLKSLSALACVDYVVLIPFTAAVEAIKCVTPDIYCKGTEYSDHKNDVTGNIVDDVETVQSLGGQVRYIGSVVFSSSRLLNNHFDDMDSSIKDFCRKLARDWTPDKFRDAVDGFKSLKVLVLGDIIFDRYSYVKVQGLTSKDRMLSGRFISQDNQAGGSLAVYRHIKRFCDCVHLMSMVGGDDKTEYMIRNYLPEGDDLVLREKCFTTVIKERFNEPVSEGKEMSKLFSVNYIDVEPPTADVVHRLANKLSRVIKDYDLVVVADFGHGVMQEPIRRMVEERAPFMALNCQTNSNNHGFNIISNQYRRADCFSLDEQELLLSSARRHIDHIRELEYLRNRFCASYAWLTRGATETIGLRAGAKPCTIPTLEAVVTDTIGAGDAFFSVASLAARQQLSSELAAFMGQLAGAQAVRIVGNHDSISKEKLVKSGMAMLNF